MTDRPFWVDDDHDQYYADRPGGSRYGSYVRQRINAFKEWDTDTTITADPVRYACAAWRVATGPIMAPGYVRHAPRILDATMERSGEDGSLLADVTLATDPPVRLNDWDGWDRDRSEWLVPGDGRLVRRPAMLALTRLLFTIPTGHLFRPGMPSAMVDIGEAKAAVAALVWGLNLRVEPVIAALEAQ